MLRAVGKTRAFWVTPGTDWGRLQGCRHKDDLPSQLPVFSRPGSELLAETTLLGNVAFPEAAYAARVFVCHRDSLFAREALLEIHILVGEKGPLADDFWLLRDISKVAAATMHIPLEEGKDTHRTP